MNNWLNFYKNKLTERYLQSLEKRYTPFITLLKKEIKKGYKIAEFGCGISNITKLIIDSYKECTYWVTDKDSDMLKLSELNIKKKIKYILFDILNQFDKKFDIIHSHGVLEHLSPNNIKKAINNQLKICSNLIHYVPSSKYNYKSFGDELLLSKQEWRALVNPTEIIEFNKGYDLILVWK